MSTKFMRLLYGHAEANTPRRAKSDVEPKVPRSRPNADARPPEEQNLAVDHPSINYK